MISMIAQAPAPFGMEGGRRYLVDNTLAGHYLVGGAPCEARVETFPPFVPELTRDLTTKSVLIIRSGGMGDIVFLTAALAKLRREFPQHEITLCSLAGHEVLLGHPDLEGVKFLAYPPLMEEVARFDFVVPLEETIERDQERDGAVIFAGHLGLTLDTPAERAPRLQASAAALKAAQERFPKLPEQRRIGVQLRASHDCRTWPINYIQELAALILDRDPRAVVFLFGKAEDFRGVEEIAHERVVWLPGMNLSLEETLAVLTLMDGFVGPDSGLLHAAGALGVPGVGIFGPYRWQQRITGSPSLVGINGQAPCAPCHHAARHAMWPAGKPCAEARCCVALAQVRPERVWSLLKRQMSDCERRRQGLPRVPQHVWALESMFGRVGQRGDCHPELERAAEYHLGDWGGGSATIEEARFLHALVLLHKPLFCLETGTETGWTAAHIAAALEMNGKGHLVTLETDAVYAAASRESLRAWDLEGRVQVVQISSLKWLVHVCGKIDFALLDTHIELRAQELELLVPHLAPGALVVVHDTNPQHPHAGEARLLERLQLWPGFDVVHFPTPRGLTLLRWRDKAKPLTEERPTEGTENTERI